MYCALTVYLDRHLHCENQFVSGSTAPNQGGERSIFCPSRRRMVLLQSSSDNPRGRCPPFPMSQMGVQGTETGAERRERFALNINNITIV